MNCRRTPESQSLGHDVTALINGSRSASSPLLSPRNPDRACCRGPLSPSSSEAGPLRQNRCRAAYRRRHAEAECCAGACAGPREQACIGRASLSPGPGIAPEAAAACGAAWVIFSCRAISMARSRTWAGNRQARGHSCRIHLLEAKMDLRMQSPDAGMPIEVPIGERSQQDYPEDGHASSTRSGTTGFQRLDNLPGIGLTVDHHCRKVAAWSLDMKAVVFEKFGGPLSVGQVADPVPADDGVVIKVQASGICRSDWHGWLGHDPDIARLPHVPGHELAGIVEETGRNVARWKRGTGSLCRSSAGAERARSAAPAIIRSAIASSSRASPGGARSPSMSRSDTPT